MLPRRILVPNRPTVFGQPANPSNQRLVQQVAVPKHSLDLRNYRNRENLEGMLRAPGYRQPKTKMHYSTNRLRVHGAENLRGLLLNCNSTKFIISKHSFKRDAITTKNQNTACHVFLSCHSPPARGWRTPTESSQRLLVFLSQFVLSGTSSFGLARSSSWVGESKWSRRPKPNDAA